MMSNEHSNAAPLLQHQGLQESCLRGSLHCLFRYFVRPYLLQTHLWGSCPTIAEYDALSCREEIHKRNQFYFRDVILIKIAFKIRPIEYIRYTRID